MLSWSNNLILDMSIFFINNNILRHLKLEIALAIPASNDEKYNWSNSAGQGLKWHIHRIYNIFISYYDNLGPFHGSFSLEYIWNPPVKIMLCV